MQRLLFVCLLSAVSSFAGMTTYSDRSVFNSQGTIEYNTNFDFFAGSFSPLGNPYTIGGVTYMSGNNLLVGPTSGYTPRTLLAYNLWTPLPAALSSNYTMLGFELASIGRLDPMTIVVTTNASSYTYSNQIVTDAFAGLTFFGFIATGGEYITNFSLNSTGSGSAPGITDIAVGDVSETPEPATAVLMAAGLAAAALFKRMR
jgi:hypothetical protein